MRFATPDDRGLIESIVGSVWDEVSCVGARQFDAVPWLAEPNIAVIADGGCLLGAWQAVGRYEVHTNFLPAFRGRVAVAQVREAMAMAFLQSDAEMLVTRVPEPNVGADWLTKKMGFRLLFERPNSWRKGGKWYGQRYYGLSIDEWICGGARRALGEEFHERLGLKLPEVAHADDPVHNCYVGALADMVISGNPEKGVEIYNRWAKFAGYETLRLLGRNPVRLDIRSAVLAVRGRDFTVEA